MHLLIPSTYAIDERDDRLRVQTYGRLARAAAIFGVDHITIYRDDDPKSDEQENARLLKKYLEYAECPPYLRKALIPYDPDLEYANIMPALQIISHGYSDEFREAVVEQVEDGESVLDAGLDADVRVSEPLSEGERITLHMGEEPTVIDPDAIEGFWTFTVEETRDDLGTVIDGLEQPVIGTSRKGEPLSSFAESRFVHEDVALAFGSAWRGIPALIDRGDCTGDQFAAMINFVPGQETKTVRTAEAVPVTLGITNALRHLG